MVKDFIIERKAELLTGAATFYLVVNIDWHYELFRLLSGIGASITSAMIVAYIKKKKGEK